MGMGVCIRVGIGNVCHEVCLLQMRACQQRVLAGKFGVASVSRIFDHVDVGACRWPIDMMECVGALVYMSVYSGMDVSISPYPERPMSPKPMLLKARISRPRTSPFFCHEVLFQDAAIPVGPTNTVGQPVEVEFGGTFAHPLEATHELVSVSHLYFGMPAFGMPFACTPQ